MAELREGLMQIFNGDNDPLFIELVGGNAFWIIPADKYKLSDVRFLTHLTDDGNLYFENMETGEVSWVFPSDDIMSESSRNNAISFQLMSRNEMENCLQAPFPESESFEQLAALDAYFDSSDGVQQQTDLADGTGSESSVPTVRPSGALRENTMNDEMNYSSDEGEGEDALAVINNKKDRLSLANSDAGSEGGDSSTPAGVSEPDSSPRPLSTLKSIETIKETTIKVFI